MFEEHYACMFDLFSSIPSIEDENVSVKDEVFEFNREVVSDARCRLLKACKKLDVSSYGLSLRHKMAMLRLLLNAKGKVGTKIEDWFPASFFETVFWKLWATSFSFQVWDNVDELRRYFVRFIHLLPGFNRFKGILRTRYNQYDALIRPTENWLRKQGVQFDMETQVKDIQFAREDGKKTATAILVARADGEQEIALGEDDLVFVTLGSMVANSTHGTMNSPPPVPPEELDGSWALWEKIAKEEQAHNDGKGPSDFGNPDAFIGRRDQTRWTSFTVTLKDSLFFDLMEKFTTNEAGTGGLVTFTDSNWFMSIVLFHQPFYIGQPDDVTVFWGDGLFPDNEGNFVKKKMSECTGEEILFEVLSHLQIHDKKAVIEQANCISTRMPFITTQFQTRAKGDRPQVIPKGATNFAFMGQYCEIPDDVVFTVEYSVRSAAMAVYSLCNLKKKVPPVYKGQYNPVVDLKALLALFR